MSEGKAIHALQTIKYAFDLESTMKFVFGIAFICEDTETAKKVCFDPRVRMPCVTLDGDIYQPNGVLSGGADENAGKMSILKQVREIQRLEEDLKFAEHRVSEQRQDLAKISQALIEQHERQQETEGMVTKLKLLRSQFDMDAKDAKQTRLKNLDEDIEEAKQKLIKLEDNSQRYDSEMKRLKQEI